MVYMVLRGVGRAADALSAQLALLPAGTAAAPVDRLVAERMTGDKSGIATQRRIDGLSNVTDQLVAEYRSVIQQLESLLPEAISIYEASQAEIGGP